MLALRLRWLQSIFGSLDRIYVLHKWLGVWAMTVILLHDTIDAELDEIGRETWVTDIAETFGEISLYGLLILAVVTIATFVPYGLWRWTHRFIGGFFVLSALHYVFMLTPFDVLDRRYLWANVRQVWAGFTRTVPTVSLVQ